MPTVGFPVPLHIVLADYNNAVFPRARVYTGTTLVTSVNLAFISSGYYESTWTPGAAGSYFVVYDIYEDSGHTTLSEFYTPDTEEFEVTEATVAGDQAVAVRQSYTLDAPAGQIIVNTWLEVNGGETTTGITNATLSLYTSTGTLLAAVAPQVVPVAEGVFRFAFSIPAFTAGENATFSVATIDYDAPFPRTIRGVTGVTFSRVL